MRISLGARVTGTPTTATNADVTPMGQGAATETARRAIGDAIRAMSTRVTMPPACLLGVQDVAGVIGDLYDTDWHATAFGLDGYGTARDGRGTVQTVTLHWAYGDDDPTGHAARCAQRVAEIACDARDASGNDDASAIAYAHDAIASGCAYATGRPDLHEAYDALCGGSAVCSGISKALMSVALRMGVPAIGVTSERMDHQWCMVMIGDAWYHVDVTYDIPQGAGEPASHDNLLRSDAAMTLTGHFAWHHARFCDARDDAWHPAGAQGDTPRAPYDWLLA